MDFGSTPPKLMNVTTHKNPEGQEAKSITVDFDFEYLGDCDLQGPMLLNFLRPYITDVRIKQECP
jgi:hypothetical protein